MTKSLTFITTIAIGTAAIAAGLTYTTPAGWKPVTTASAMRVAQFALPRAAGDAQDGELVVYYFGGSGGTVDANIERWLGQMQQPDGKPSSAVGQARHANRQRAEGGAGRRQRHLHRRDDAG